jgi:hypothetical protein
MTSLIVFIEWLWRSAKTHQVCAQQSQEKQMPTVFCIHWVTLEICQDTLGLCLHNKVKNNKCQQCFYSLSNSGDLSWHIKCVHSKVKNNKWLHWLYSLSDSGDLSRHIKSDLSRHIKWQQRHIKWQQQNQEQKCPQCLYSLSNLGYLSRHIKCVHKKSQE